MSSHPQSSKGTADIHIQGDPPEDVRQALGEAARAAYSTAVVLVELSHERDRQNAKWGEQNHQDGTGGKAAEDLAATARVHCDTAFMHGAGSWRDILAEEVAEAFAESDPAKLRKELVEVAAVAVAWVEAIDRRKGARHA